MSQYPHYLYVVTANNPTMNSNGDWIQSGKTTRFIGRCREETNGKGSVINTDDFKPYQFSSLVQCPLGTEEIKPKTIVIVTDAPLDDGGKVRIQGACAKFDSGQLHCRLWV